MLTLDAPKEVLQYRVNLALDVTNSATGTGGEVVLYLDVSIEGGMTYTNRAKNSHVTNAGFGTAEGRQMQVWLPLTPGSSLGVSDAAPPANIKLRARANQVVGTTDLAVSSLATSDGGDARRRAERDDSHGAGGVPVAGCRGLGSRRAGAPGIQ